MITCNRSIMKWKDKAIRQVLKQLKNSPQHKELYGQVLSPDHNRKIHLAVFVEPFMTLLLDGTKSMESRFSSKRTVPYGKVSKGDIILVKKSGGAVTGLFVAGNVIYDSNLTSRKLQHVEKKYGKEICSNMDPEFWQSRSYSRYMTLIEVSKPIKLLPFRIDKSDRTAWSILRGDNDSFPDLFDETQ